MGTQIWWWWKPTEGMKEMETNSRYNFWAQQSIRENITFHPTLYYNRTSSLSTAVCSQHICCDNIPLQNQPPPPSHLFDPVYLICSQLTEWTHNNTYLASLLYSTSGRDRWKGNILEVGVPSLETEDEDEMGFANETVPYDW